MSSSPESATRDRYAAVALCCPVSYDPKYLEAIPAEVIEKDYAWPGYVWHDVYDIEEKRL